MHDLTLPPLLVLTDRAQAAPRPLTEVLRQAVGGGARAVVLREKDLPAAERVRLARDLRPIVDVLLASSGLGDPDDASGAHELVDGVQLAAADPLPTRRPRVLGRSCHGVASVAAAVREGCDYVTVSPVFPTASKPGYGPPLGLAGLRDAVAAAGPVRVYALGGVTPANAAACIDAGASGVAVMGAVMRASDPAAVVAELLDRLVREGVRP